jgi:hypothetical protein
VSWPGWTARYVGIDASAIVRLQVQEQACSGGARLRSGAPTGSARAAAARAPRWPIMTPFRTGEYPNLPILADKTGKTGYIEHATVVRKPGTEAKAPVVEESGPGTALMEQSFHALFLFFAALIIATV